MKTIKQTSPPCPCMTKLWDFYATQVDESGVPTLGVGSIVECDCGTQYTLSEDQRDGKFWARLSRSMPAYELPVA